MPRGGGPEEFFEVFREVQAARKEGQAAKKDHGDSPALPQSPPAVLQDVDEAPGGAFTISYLAAGAVVVIVALIAVLAFLLGRNYGWDACEAALRRQPEQAASPKASTGIVPGFAAQAEELIDGRAFVMLTGEKTPAARGSAEKEAEHLNRHPLFLKYGLVAYVWRDALERYRVGVRGFARMDEATRIRVRDEIRRLPSRDGKPLYADAGFY